MFQHLKLALLIIPFLLGACVSGPKRIENLEKSLSDRSELNQLCEARVSGACALLGQPARPLHPLPIMQSVTSSEQSRIVVLAPPDSNLSYFVAGWGGVRKLQPKPIQNGETDERVDQLEVFELKLGEYYELVVVDQNGKLWDRRKFKALDLKKPNAKFILTSCMDDYLADVQKVMWRDVSEQNPDAILMIGDTVYADWSEGKRAPITNADQLWRRYSETRSKLDIFKVSTLIPVIAVWDDHDYGKNDSDRTWIFKETATATFLTFFDQARPAPGFERGPGVSSWWRAFGVQFALLDDRSFRSPNGLDLPDQTHLGVDQEQWLKEGLAAAPGPVLLISGDQFFGNYHRFESFEGDHPRNFKAQLARWRRVSAHPIVFMSGDRHLTEIIKVPKEHLGYPTYEITSSGIHAKVFADAFKDNPSPNQLVGRAGEYNYSLIEINEASDKSLKLDVKSFGLHKALLYQQTLTVNR